MIAATAPISTITPQADLSIKKNRIESIDLLRGLVMIIMALDHVRDYFHADAFLFNPVNLDKTNVPLFFTRWITHFCAPVFVFLAGTSAFLVGERKGKKELSAFLFKRGLWLILLEVTIINFAWFFNIQFSLITLTVIWALGFGMIALAAVAHLPYRAILIIGVVLVAGHNLLDGIHSQGDNAGAIGWALLHEFKGFQLGHFFLYIGYPVIAWTGIMFLGYCFGALYKPGFDADRRKTILLRLGSILIVSFLVIRYLNVYGDPSPWTVRESATFSFLSFMNVTKYPPSLLYILATLGPAMLFLTFTERVTGKLSSYVTALGRVPLFYYIAHLYLIHIVAIIAALTTGYSLSDMVFTTWVTDSPNLKGFGFNLGVVYLVWAGIVLSLFPICLWYDRYKTLHREKWWLSYM
jgi:uncharacterized membrane protein